MWSSFPKAPDPADGFMRPFQMNAAQLAVQSQVPVIPVGILGTYAAMPRGSYWPLAGTPTGEHSVWPADPSPAR